MKDPNGFITIQGRHRKPEALSRRRNEQGQGREKEKKCHDAIRQWIVVAQDEGSVLVEWHPNPCRYWPEEEQSRGLFSARIAGICDLHRKNARNGAGRPRAIDKTFSGATFESITMAFDPDWISVDVDEFVPLEMDKVGLRLSPLWKPRTATFRLTASRIECTRPRVYPTWSKGGSGGESVTATLEAKGDQAHVTITTGLGFYARLAGKKNWSAPIFEGMLKNLQKNPQPSSQDSLRRAALSISRCAIP